MIQIYAKSTFIAIDLLGFCLCSIPGRNRISFGSIPVAGEIKADHGGEEGAKNFVLFLRNLIWWS